MTDAPPPTPATASGNPRRTRCRTAEPRRTPTTGRRSARPPRRATRAGPSSATPVQLAGGQPVGGEPVELLVAASSTRSAVAPGGRCACSRSAVGSRTSNGVAHEAEVAADVGDRSGRACTSRSTQPGRVAVGEHLGEHDVRQVAVEVVDRVGHPPAERDRRQRRQRVGVLRAPLGGRRRLVEVGPGRRGRAGARRRSAARSAPCASSGVEVAGDREHRVAGGVVAVEEVARRRRRWRSPGRRTPP